jgi:hypothetical protein
VERRLRQDLEPVIITATTPEAATISRYWKTGLIISQADITGLVTSDPGDAAPGGGRCVLIPAGSAGIDLAAIRELFLSSMNALADADDAPSVRNCEVTVQVWRDGYDQPAFASQSRYTGWTVLAASAAPEHSESGCLAFADPRAGSAGTAMPGLPWGRQFLMTPVPGAHAVVPGWLTCSVVPLEQGQHLTVAVAASIP